MASGVCGAVAPPSQHSIAPLVCCTRFLAEDFMDTADGKRKKRFEPGLAAADVEEI